MELSNRKRVDDIPICRKTLPLFVPPTLLVQLLFPVARALAQLWGALGSDSPRHGRPRRVLFGRRIGCGDCFSYVCVRSVARGMAGPSALMVHWGHLVIGRLRKVGESWCGGVAGWSDLLSPQLGSSETADQEKKSRGMKLGIRSKTSYLSLDATVQAKKVRSKSCRFDEPAIYLVSCGGKYVRCKKRFSCPVALAVGWWCAAAVNS